MRNTTAFRDWVSYNSHAVAQWLALNPEASAVDFASHFFRLSADDILQDAEKHVDAQIREQEVTARAALANVERIKQARDVKRRQAPAQTTAQAPDAQTVAQTANKLAAAVDARQSKQA